MPRENGMAKYEQFSLLRALLGITSACILLGSWQIAENPAAPYWAQDFCGAGILAGLYGLMALVVMQFVE